MKLRERKVSSLINDTIREYDLEYLEESRNTELDVARLTIYQSEKNVKKFSSKTFITGNFNSNNYYNNNFSKLMITSSIDNDRHNNYICDSVNSNDSNISSIEDNSDNLNNNVNENKRIITNNKIKIKSSFHNNIVPGNSVNKSSNNMNNRNNDNNYFLIESSIKANDKKDSCEELLDVLIKNNSVIKDSSTTKKNNKNSNLSNSNCTSKLNSRNREELVSTGEIVSLVKSSNKDNINSNTNSHSRFKKIKNNNLENINENHYLNGINNINNIDKNKNKLEFIDRLSSLNSYDTISYYGENDSDVDVKLKKNNYGEISVEIKHINKNRKARKNNNSNNTSCNNINNINNNSKYVNMNIHDSNKHQISYTNKRKNNSINYNNPFVFKKNKTKCQYYSNMPEYRELM